MMVYIIPFYYLYTNHLYRWFLIPHEIQYLFYTLYILCITYNNNLVRVFLYIYIILYFIDKYRRITVLLFVC